MPQTVLDKWQAFRTELDRRAAEIARLRAALEKIAFITGGIDTPATSNAAHYEATRALTEGEPPSH
jgi:hypothetical protein